MNSGKVDLALQLTDDGNMAITLVKSVCQTFSESSVSQLYSSLEKEDSG